ncbi:MAG TPA: HAMP domain-containing sensor histidine kinase [Candidatus Baltobacteraceae bacterium]|jgi:two-component system OmpR family sensor kinase|nr:HAMP domain-containing sensor histidine kinase [Candidatus Baltobacteraceae bacterium]
MHLLSLRSRLIAWHIMTGALVVVCLAILMAALTGGVLAYQGREAMLSAARQIPTLAASYRSEGGSVDGFDAYLAQRLAPLPVLTHTDTEFMPHRPGRHGWPHQNVAIRMLMEQMHPMDVTYDGTHTMIFVAPSFYERSIEYYLLAMLIVAIIVISASWRIATVVAASSLDPLLRTTAALNRFGDGDFTPASVSTNDTSEVGELAKAYNRAVRQITRALDERAQASAEMRQFVADAGHQLRTPLTVVIGYLSSMAARNASESDPAQVATMLGQSRRMKTLIDDLIVLARLEHVAPLRERAFDVNDVVSELPQAFSPEDQRRLHVELSSTPVMVHAADSEFREALVALTENAVKYGGAGAVTISVGRAGDQCEVVVRDGGPGFSSQDLESAFDRFYRGAASEGTVGTGLGLSIAAKVIARARGVIELFNLQGGGAGCAIRVPLT